MYRREDVVAVAKRENNNKRKYLVVNRKQGKHMPVSPGEAMAMFHVLAEMLREEYKDETMLLVGFAETATAIGAFAAAELDSYYIQTTREEISGVNFLLFSEAHSHATEQKLVRDDLDRVIGRIDRVVFIEDEVTTGNTILSAIDKIEETYPNVEIKFSTEMKFSVASLLNGMDREAEERYRSRGIRVHYLIRTDHASYTKIAEQYAGDGIYEKAVTEEPDMQVREAAPSGYLDARRLQRGADYYRACRRMVEEMLPQIDTDSGKRYLVLGTEEFMFPAMLLADEMEKKGCFVRFHATTRSPIAVSSEPEYPLHIRYELVSMYEADRRTFVYELKQYDGVIVVCDAECISDRGKNTLLNALAKSGNQNITMVRWHG